MKFVNLLYPHASAFNVIWEKASVSEWEANFSINNTSVSGNYTADGQWQETETEIAVSLLPEKFWRQLQKLIPG